MTNVSNRLTLTLALCLLLNPVADVFANTDEARRAARTAERSVARDRYEDAARSLAAVDCQDDAGCKTLIAFSYGWLYESWADSGTVDSSAHLARAQAYYQRAHESSPTNLQILDNLALVSGRIGDSKTAAKAIASAIKLDPGSAYERYLSLGDLLSSLDDVARARAMYQRAVKINPSRSDGHQRLLEAYRKAGAYENLLDHSLGIRWTLPEVAATGFGYSIRLSFAKDSDSAEKALIYWTAIRSDLGTLTTEGLNTLSKPGAWNSSAISELRAVVASRQAPPVDWAIGWWRETAIRQDAMARLFRLKAARIRAGADRRNVSQERRVAAMSSAVEYLTAAVDLAPQFYAYLNGNLSGSSNVKLDAAADLVALHHTLVAGSEFQGLSGVSEEDLKEMTNVLFSGKSGAYASGQLDAIQRYHTVLGMVYYETGRLKSDWADNATFQLEHALETAAKITRKDPSKYQPLPELQVLLADVYQQRERTKDSARMSLNAAMGFLETDNLPAASKSLQQAQQDGVNKERAAAVKTVLTGRVAVSSGSDELLRAEYGTLNEMLGSEIAWLGDPESLNLPQRFVDGQKFKTLTDLGSQVTSSGNRSAA